MAVLRVLSHHGDESFEYDGGVEDARLERARRTFAAKIARGYLAFVPDGRRSRSGTQIRRFDRSAPEILLQPPLVGG